MKKITKNLVLVLVGISFTTIATAQVSQVKIGENPTMISPNAVLEIESRDKGLLLPRLALTSTDSFTPLTAHVEGMTVYNTATAGTGETAVTPGYYYNDGSKWVKIATGADAKTEPWFDQVTNTEATLNTQNIYQMGSVAIGKEEVYEGAALDVAGAIRAGADHQGEVGQYSAAFGLLNEASGTYTLATGSESIANGDHAISMGYMTIASGNYGSIAVGNESIASGQSAVAMGNNAKASNSGSISLGQITDSQGIGSVALGQGTVASTHGEVSVGIANAITTGASHVIEPTDALFQIGNGSSSGTTVFSRSNAVTVLKNAHTGIGIAGTESDAKPTEMLDIGSKGVRIRDINTAAYSGNSATDNIVVADPNGVLKTVDVSQFAVTASNGLNVDTASKDVKLGGTLAEATVITADDTNTLSIVGLEEVADWDDLLGIMAVENDGIIRTVQLPEPTNYQYTSQDTGKKWVDNKPVYEVVADITLTTNTNVIDLSATDLALNVTLINARLINKATNSLTTNIISYDKNTKELVIGMAGTMTTIHPAGEYYIILEYIK